jgi:hypothetical protein
MTLNQPTANSLTNLLSRLLDRGYDQIVGSILDAMVENTESGALGRRLDELETEAAELETNGERLSYDNAVLTALRADLDTATQQYANDLDHASGAVLASGLTAAGLWVRQTSLPGVSDDELPALGIRWNSPDPEALNAVVDYTSRFAWQMELSRYQSGIGQVARNIAIRGVLEGQNPTTTARELREMVTGLPIARANAIMRTLQMQAYRDAVALHQLANAEIFTEQIRIAALDDRCCLACVALHGTRMPIGEVVQDHHNGRCTSVAVVRGRDFVVPSGQVWFNSLSEQEQIEIAGPANYAAMQAGAVTLADFVQPYFDPVFGQMLRERSLSGILGSEAEQYYT